MNILKIPAGALVATGLLLLVSGCSHIMGPQPAGKLPSTGFTTTEPSGDGQALNGASLPGATPQGAISPELQEAIAKLNVQIQVSSAANLNAAEFEQVIRGQLANAGFSFIPGDPADLRMNIALESELFDQSSNYRIYTGRAIAELWRNIDGKQLAGNTFTAKGERKLGEREAILNLQGQLATEVKSWIARQIMPDRIGVAASELTLQLHHIKILKGGDQEEISRVINAIQGIPGVQVCRQIENDADSRRYRFRVVYFPEKFPMGLSNAAAEACGYRTR